MSAEKTCWSEIKHQIQKINPEFYEVFEEVKPKDSLPLTITKYAYGQTFSDDKNFYLPNAKGISSTPFKGRNPLSMILDNTLEFYFETISNVIPWMVFRPGDFLPLMYWSEILSPYRLSPGSIFTTTAGSRSSFLLSLYSKNEAYARLKQQYGISNDINPENTLDHYKIFKTIAEKEASPWRTTILCFDEKWFSNILNEKKWSPVKMYFYQQALKRTSCFRNAPFLNYAMHDIYKKNNYKHKEYSEDIIKQLFFTALGALPTFIPAHDETGLPLNLLANTFNEHYGTYNLPIIMQSQKSQNLKETFYLSVSHNTSTTYDIKTFRPFMYLMEIKEYLEQYLKEFQSHALTKNTIYEQLHERLSVTYYSEKGNPKQGILKAADLHRDARILKTYKKYQIKQSQTFPERAPFLKAFMGITFK